MFCLLAQVGRRASVTATEASKGLFHLTGTRRGQQLPHHTPRIGRHLSPAAAATYLVLERPAQPVEPPDRQDVARSEHILHPLSTGAVQVAAA